MKKNKEELELMKKVFKEEIYLNSNRLKESFISNNYSEFYSFIIDNYNSESFLQKLYDFYHGKKYCYCGKITNFINFQKGYLKFCSISCSSKDLKTRDKYKKTCMERHGVDNVSKIESVKKKKEEKSYKKYGFKSPLESKEIKQKIFDKYGVYNVFELRDIQEKIRKTNLDKYGNECVLLSDTIRKKTIKTNLKKYGHEHFSKTNIWKEKILSLNNNNFINSLSLSNDYEFISKDKNTNVIKHKKCGEQFEIQTQLLRIRKNNNIEICKFCNSVNYQSENSLLNFIESIYNGEVKKYRDNKYEIDIFLPDLNLGFEFNGLYWHSELYKDNDYHSNKSEYFNKMGIRIIHIWEDDWSYKNDIIKSIIRSNLGLYDRVIYARNCKLVKLSDKNSKEFLIRNHIQGWSVSKYRYGLVDKISNELVSLITTGSLRLNLGKKNTQNEEIEIIRFCNKIDTLVIGGFSKILKSIINDIKCKTILTYSDYSMFTGDVYLKNKFNLINKTEPGYYYIVGGIRKNRFNFNKTKLIKMGFDKNKTEKEIMFDNKYYRIYDCGNLKFILNI